MKTPVLISVLVVMTSTNIILHRNTKENAFKLAELEFQQEITVPSDSLVLLSAAKLLKTNASNLKILNSKTVKLDYLEESYRAVKIFNKLTSETNEMTFDMDGKPVDYEAIFQKNKETKFQKMGNLHPTLHAALQNNQLLDEVEVIIKIKVGGMPNDKSRQTQSEPKDYQKKLQKALEDFKSMVEKEKFNGVFTYYPSSPFVTAILSIEEINKLSKSEYVEFVGLHGEMEVFDEIEKVN